MTTLPMQHNVFTWLVLVTVLILYGLAGVDARDRIQRTTE